MSRYLSLTSLALLLLVVFSCQKEISYETGQKATGSLLSSSGDCLPKTIHGTYKAGQGLADSNYIEVTIDATLTGTYRVTTDTVNGYWFSAAGSFSTTGSNTVRLAGHGTPSTAGTNVFNVHFDSSVCAVPVTVLPGSGGSGGSAVFTLQTSAGSCMNSSVTGTYTQGVALNATDSVSIQVNVTTVGTWSVTTNTVTGFSFSGSGSFTTTGVQTIKLAGTGTPTTSGSQTFSVTAGTASCTFSVTVASGTTPPPPTGDHFILTDNSWWSYSTPLSASDTLKRTISGGITAGGVSYKLMKEKNVGGQINDSLYFRKSGNNYYELNYVDYYTSFYFDNVVVDSLLFLKEGLTTGQSWNSPEYADSVGGVPTKVKYLYTCTDANATVSLNSKTYNNVYIITLKVQSNTNGAGYVDDVTWINYYAPGIGWIYQKYNDGTSQYELPVRYYQVF